MRLFDLSTFNFCPTFSYSPVLLAQHDHSNMSKFNVSLSSYDVLTQKCRLRCGTNLKVDYIFLSLSKKKKIKLIVLTLKKTPLTQGNPVGCSTAVIHIFLRTYLTKTVL
jgi:hypothetical protein